MVNSSKKSQSSKKAKTSPKAPAKSSPKSTSKTPTKSSSKWLKPFFILIALAAVITSFVLFIINTACPDYIVETNAFFAPFEFYDGAEIKGVDVDIVNRVAEKLNKNISITNVDFAVIIDNVASGKVADAGAAGITVTEARKELVDFTIPYYTSSQYVIFDKTKSPATVNGSYITWEALTGKIIGTQTDTTGYLFTDGEIAEGVLKDTGTTLKGFESAQLAADGISANLVDAVIVDKLPAEYIVKKNSNLACLPLYYAGTNGEPDSPAEESYAIAINKDRPELLQAFNEVLTDMIASGEIDKLIMKYMAL